MKTNEGRARKRNTSVSSFGVGRTIAEEREKIESESERIAAREKAKNRQTISILTLVLGLMVIGILVVIGIRSLAEGANEPTPNTVETIEPSATLEIVDESGAGITGRARNFIGAVEKELSGLGYKVARVAVPAGKRREVDIYIEGVPYYLKMNIDRGAAVSAEDADRIIRYLSSAGLNPGYVDIRVEGKAYYR